MSSSPSSRIDLDRAEADDLEARGDDRGVADQDRDGALEVDVRLRGGEDIVDQRRASVHPLAIGGQLVVGQVVDDQSGQRLDDRAGVSKRSKTPMR